MGYGCLLALRGGEEKISITKRFLAAKEKEYYLLRREIEAPPGEISFGDSADFTGETNS